jgi:Fic family protein
MMTLARFEIEARTDRLVVPASVAWTLEDIGASRGRQDLFAQQAPQLLKKLRESAMIESAISSNRIEGVEIEPRRVGTVMFGTRALCDRDEAEVRGYRDALRLVDEQPERLDVTEDTVKELHAISRARTGDAGQYKVRDIDIVERLSSGESRVRFHTVPAVSTPAAVAAVLAEWQQWEAGRWLAPLVATAAFSLDFLCIHPFRDGNGRTSRLLLLLQCYRLGYDVGRYISLERLIEEHKDRYYETLQQASLGWHDGRHDPWPYINFVLFIVRAAYREFERCAGDVRAPRGSKGAGFD